MLNLLTADQLKTALTEIAGETSTAVAPAGNQAMNSFLTEIFRRRSDRNGTFGGNQPSPLKNIRPMTVKLLGYVIEDPRVQQAAATISAVGKQRVAVMVVRSRWAPGLAPDA